MDDKITLRVTQQMRTDTFCTTEDIIVVKEDGSVAVIPKGTLIAYPVPKGPLLIENL